MLRLVVLLAVLVAVSVRGSPNADTVEDLMNYPGGASLPEDLIQDALRDVPGLIANHDYPSEVHSVVTSDGYILELHRIPHGLRGTPGGTPVLLMHGLLSSSADYVNTGPQNALGFILADAGYDVWLGNARGNYYSRHHIRLNPDSFLNKNFWRFSWDQIGNYDLPALIDYILATTGHEKLHYIGHSQGGTTFLVLNSLRPEYNDKFISFQGLAPACFFENNENPRFKTLAQFESIIENLAFALNAQEIFGSRDFITKHCVEVGSKLDNVCQIASSDMHSGEYYNSTLVPVIMAHTPAGASIRQLSHYGQVIRFKSFRRYNYNIVTNIREYGSVIPPEYNLSLITVPTYLHYGLDDEQVDYRDVFKLANTLPNVISVNEAERETFSHFDFLWAVDVKELIYDDVLDAMKDAENKFL